MGDSPSIQEAKLLAQLRSAEAGHPRTSTGRLWVGPGGSHSSGRWQGQPGFSARLLMRVSREQCRVGGAPPTHDSRRSHPEAPSHCVTSVCPVTAAWLALCCGAATGLALKAFQEKIRCVSAFVMKTVRPLSISCIRRLLIKISQLRLGFLPGPRLSSRHVMLAKSS